MRLVNWAGSEEERVTGPRPCGPTLAELEGPQAIDLERRSVGAMQLAKQHGLTGVRACSQIVDVDLAIAEVADQ